jgi:hypothetical protein
MTKRKPAHPDFYSQQQKVSAEKPDKSFFRGWEDPMARPANHILIFRKKY